MSLQVLRFLPRPDDESGVSSWTLETTEFIQGTWVSDDGLARWAVWRGTDLLENGTSMTQRQARLASRIALVEVLAGIMSARQIDNILNGRGDGR